MMINNLLRIILPAALLLFMPSGTTNATPGNSSNRLQQAADAYTNADYAQAAAIYEQILADGYEAFELYYNLGNAHFKNDRIAAAILSYERAARIDPTDPDLSHNLAMARARTVDKIEMLPVPEFVSSFKSFVNAVSADRWGMYSLLAFVLTLVSASVFLFAPQKWAKQLTLGTGILLLLLSFTFLLFGWQQKKWLNSRKEAIIFQPSITVQSTPDNSGEELFVLHEGTKVRIVERFREWVRIRIGDGKTGWLTEESIEEI